MYNIIKFQETFKNISDNNSEDDTLSYLYNELTELLINRDLDNLIKIIEILNPETIYVSCSIGVLIMTSRIKKIEIEEIRQIFYNRLENFLIETRGNKETKELLFNLNPKQII